MTRPTNKDPYKAIYDAKDTLEQALSDCNVILLGFRSWNDVWNDSNGKPRKGNAGWEARGFTGDIAIFETEADAQHFYEEQRIKGFDVVVRQAVKVQDCTRNFVGTISHMAKDIRGGKV